MTRKKPRAWKWGEKADLARRGGISPQYLNDIIHARKRAPHVVATRLARAAEELALGLTRDDFLYPCESENPLIEVSI